MKTEKTQLAEERGLSEEPDASEKQTKNVPDGNSDVLRV